MTSQHPKSLEKMEKSRSEKESIGNVEESDGHNMSLVPGIAPHLISSPVELILRDCKMDTLPEDIWVTLPNLRKVCLWQNNFNKIPDGLRKLEKLLELSMSRNPENAAGRFAGAAEFEIPSGQ